MTNGRVTYSFQLREPRRGWAGVWDCLLDAIFGIEPPRKSETYTLSFTLIGRDTMRGIKVKKVK